MAAGGTHAGQIIMTIELDDGAPADFETENARLRRELSEARQQQIALSEGARTTAAARGHYRKEPTPRARNAMRLP